MSYQFNPLIFAGLELGGTGSSPSGPTFWKDPVANEAALPLIGNTDGDARVTSNNEKIYVWDATASRWVDSGITIAVFGSVPNSSGLSIGSDTSTPNVSRRTLVLQPADSSNPGAISTTSQSFSGTKTFLNTLLANGGIDVAATVGTDTLTIGGTNADVVNIGRSGATINLVGTTINQQVTNLNVTDKNITLNSGGAVGSGATAGIDVEEAGSITGYVEVSGDRNSWSLKAPNTVGVATITPGASGITLNQSSHDPVTLATTGSTPNSSGASLSGQQLTLQPADATNPGLITAGTQSIGGNKTFTGTISASNLSGTNTGDVTLAPVGASPNANAATLTGQQLNLEPANATNPGVVTTGTQTLAGAKTFSSLLTAQNSIALTGHISSADYIDFTNGAATPYAQGRLFYDHQNNSLSYYTDINGFRIHIGYENAIRVRNTTGSTIVKGEAVYVNGANGQYPTIALAKANSSSTAQVIAVVQQDVLDGAYTDVISFGVIENLNTFGYTAGQTLYLSATTAGQLTTTPPSSPNYEVEVGVVLYAHPTQGKLLVNISTPKQKTVGDVAQNSWSGLLNNTLNQSITSLAFSTTTVRGFQASVSIYIDATTDLYAKYNLEAVQKSGFWELSTDFTGDLIPDIAFNVTAGGQVQVSIGNITGFVSGSVHFRAEALSI